MLLRSKPRSNTLRAVPMPGAVLGQMPHSRITKQQAVHVEQDVRDGVPLPLPLPLAGSAAGVRRGHGCCLHTALPPPSSCAPPQPERAAGRRWRLRARTAAAGLQQQQLPERGGGRSECAAQHKIANKEMATQNAAQGTPLQTHTRHRHTHCRHTRYRHRHTRWRNRNVVSHILGL